MKRTAFALLALLAAAPVAGQEWLVSRERFRYIGTRLTIDVVSEAPGTLRLIRGQDGWVAVAGRVPVGFTAAGLTDDDHLTLSAAGTGPVDYMVTVPEGVWVVVRLPDRSRTEAIGGHTRLRTLEWGEAVAAAEVDARSEVSVLPSEELGTGLFTTYTAPLAPRAIAIPDLAAIRNVTVRTGGTRFRIGASRPLSLEPGSPNRFEIRPTGDPMDLVIEVPDGTAAFELTAAGLPALTLEGGELNPRCGPLTRQWLSDGRQWVTFTPVDGRLECGPPATVRHKG